MERNYYSTTDVLVIGGGGAGMRAAIEAAHSGCRVIVANKGPVGRSGTTPMAMEAFQCVCSPDDSEELHFRDTVEGGRFLGDESLIRVLVGNTRQRVQDLENFGVRFKRKSDGSFEPMHHPGQAVPRTLFIQGGGFGMLAGLVREAKKSLKIEIRSDVFVFKLLADREGLPSGAIYLDLRDGIVKAIYSKAVVLATGGYEGLWAFNDASSTTCGDGIFLAYQLGAKLVDMEMLQFYPTIVIHPPAVKGTLFQYELVINPEMLGGRLLNGQGDLFFEGMPLRDALIRAIWREVQMGRGTEHGGVFIDLTQTRKTREELTQALEKWQPNQFHYLKDMGVDLRDMRVEVAPHAHFTMGGIAIDEQARTTIPGLWAAGEVAGNLHGANRVSGNALAETQVYGVLAGASAAAFAKNKETPAVQNFSAEGQHAEVLLNGLKNWSKQAFRPFQIRKKLQEIMWSSCGVERDEEGLERGRAEVQKLAREAFPPISINQPLTPSSSLKLGAYPQEIQETLEVRMMLALSSLILDSAFLRRETRGHHVRLDYPHGEDVVKHTFLVWGREPWQEAVRRESPSFWKK